MSEMNFVTLFDQSYAPQGLALIESISTQHPNANIWIIAMDDVSHKLLSELQYPNVKIIEVNEITTHSFVSVSNKRSLSEYCWTAKPFAVSEVFRRNPLVDSVALIDANMYLLQSFESLFREFKKTNRTTMIIRHAFSPEYDQTRISGEFCSSLVFFHRRALDSLLPDWEGSCVLWCSDTPENGLFSDQKYLESWSYKFENEVKVFSKDELLGAPWNIKDRTDKKLVAYKFQGLRFLTKERVLLTESYDLGGETIELIYRPYCQLLFEMVKLMESAGIPYSLGRASKDRRRTRAISIALAKGRLRPNSPYVIQSN